MRSHYINIKKPKKKKKKISNKTAFTKWHTKIPTTNSQPDNNNKHKNVKKKYNNPISKPNQTNKTPRDQQQRRFKLNVYV